LRQQAKENIVRYVDERLPEEYEKCLVGLNSILKEAWTMSQIDDNVKSDRIKALALAKECYAMKLELLTNATVVDDAIRFVASRTTLPKATPMRLCIVKIIISLRRAVSSFPLGHRRDSPRQSGHPSSGLLCKSRLEISYL
jgi:hypothetical protein